MHNWQFARRPPFLFSFSLSRRIAIFWRSVAAYFGLSPAGPTERGTAYVTFDFVHKAGSGLGEYNETCPDSHMRKTRPGRKGETRRETRLSPVLS
jgi:hypothetical protein